MPDDKRFIFPPSEGRLFRKVMGNTWEMLHPDIQARFSHNPVPEQPLYYHGVLSELYCSWLGKILAFCTMPLIKGALIPYCDRNFPVDIQVYAKKNSQAIFKQRTYHLHGRKPIQFTSYMQESPQGEVLEYVGMGLGMKLILSVQQGNLHFVSDGYFWQIFSWRMPLPAIFTPGKTYLWHNNDAPNQFNIRIEIKHCLFGTTFTQIGVFQQLNAENRAD